MQIVYTNCKLNFMKKIILSIFATMYSLTFAVQPVNAQEVEVDTVDIDSIIPVIAYISKNDSTTYQQVYSKIEISDNDTIVKSFYAESFMLVVKDSTEVGYEIEYIPVSHETLNDSITAEDKTAETLWNGIKDIRFRFLTDECGAVKGIVNWQKMRDAMQTALSKAATQMMDADNDTIFNRPAFISWISSSFNTEENLMASFIPTSRLFSLHGSEMKIGRNEYQENNALGYPSIITAVAMYDEPKDDEEELNLEGDYTIASQSITEIPSKDLMKMGIELTKSFLKEDITSKIEEKKNEVEKVSEELGSAKVTLFERYSYFYNGWPKINAVQKETVVGNKKRFESSSVSWVKLGWQ